jgi:uncharacterized membrane protein
MITRADIMEELGEMRMILESGKSFLGNGLHIRQESYKEIVLSLYGRSKELATIRNKRDMRKALAYVKSTVGFPTIEDWWSNRIHATQAAMTFTGILTLVIAVLTMATVTGLLVPIVGLLFAILAVVTWFTLAKEHVVWLWNYYRSR